jgi:phosphoserine phosphatase RsbU/P
MKILIAEDDLISQHLLSRSLEVLGHTVTISQDGLAALEIYQTTAIDLVISDWHMPRLEGLELCQAMRSLPRQRYPYFILLTATDLDQKSYAKAIASGVDDFLVKPMDRSVIAMRLHVAERIINFTSEIQLLKKLLPICMYCKKISRDENDWQNIEAYVQEHTGSDLTHGICPECSARALEEARAMI